MLVLHTFEELSSSSEQLVRLLARAKDEGDWELCKELARFLMALDESGATLVEALEMVDLRRRDERGSSSFLFEGSRLKVPRPIDRSSHHINEGNNSDYEERSDGSAKDSGSEGYFSSRGEEVSEE